MSRIALSLLAGICCLSLPVGCGEAGSSGATATTGAAGSDLGFGSITAATAGRTAAETALAFVTAWEQQDAAALETLLTADTRSARGLGGGMGKWLTDQRGSYSSPLPGQSRVLAVAEQGGAGTADVAVAYPCSDCAGDRLPDWPPPDSAAVSARLTLERAASGLWLVSYLDGSDHLRLQAGPTRTVRAAATNTAYAASMETTRTAQGKLADATATARTASAAATGTAGQESLHATATALWTEWFAQPTVTPLSPRTK